MHCAKGDFPHSQYAVYLHAIDARRVVKCGIEAVTWCDVTANHRRAFHTPQFRILPLAEDKGKSKGKGKIYSHRSA